MSSVSSAASLIQRNITGWATAGFAPQTTWDSASGMSSYVQGGASLPNAW
jgi:hypothetical protein